MKWNSKSIETFVSAREFVDTVLIPLMPLDLHHDPASGTLQGEYAALLAEQAERKLTGRLLLMPPLPYKPDIRDEQSLLVFINDWIHYYHNGGINNVFFLTTDSDVASLNLSENGHMIWMPVIPIHELEPQQARKMVEQQADQIIPKIMKKWEEKND
ncbi:YpiF family protein [Salisediminibacterium selenitireducens]|uniref:DUF2487 domain-containing protein n=1 Tax=Bacillus selenitireducens (strain ATCC 700615 / DSM 15326 / MLS10) TaxID=439292 RepID=D6XUY4_BACIE|nr:YpiF family protein [Salisediminibacterium selenitireducens]ADH99620.1 hypothetical protein Bsel_2116 [[Bacillus] selenitireducens MLS10]